MKRLGSVHSRGVPLLFYSPSSTESAKRGENGQLVSKKIEKRPPLFWSGGAERGNKELKANQCK